MVDFLVIGPYNAIIYNEVFPLFKDDVISLGVSRRGMSFINNDVEINSCWFTNLDHPGPVPLTLKKGGEYRKFDNYDAINIDRVSDIPDYDGVMGVPVTFMEYWNHHQFELIGLLSDNKGDGVYVFNGIETETDERHKRSKCGVMDGKRMFNRLLIKRK